MDSKTKDANPVAKIYAFFAALFLILASAVGVKFVWLQNFELWMRELRLPVSLGATNDFLQTSAGPFHRDHPIATEVLGIVFPGYEAEIAALRPTLLERNQFAVVSLLLKNGRQTTLNVPRQLPFDLARIHPPDVLILGSSRTREGIRPDVLAEALPYVQRVINGSVSGATMRTIELILDQFMSAMDGGRPKLLLIALDDVSFFHKPGNHRLWEMNLEAVDEGRSWKNRARSFGRYVLQQFPQLQGNHVSPLQSFDFCPASRTQAALASIQFSWKPFLHDGIDRDEAAAFIRVVSKARRAADHVIFLQMPLVDGYREFLDERFPYQEFVEANLEGNIWLRRSNADWGIETRDFFGAKGDVICGIDLQHLNPAAGIRFSTSLASTLSAILRSLSKPPEKVPPVVDSVAGSHVNVTPET